MRSKKYLGIVWSAALSLAVLPGAALCQGLETLQLSVAGPAGARTTQTLVVPYPSVPTDVTGIGGSLGHAREIRKQLLGEDRNTLPDSHGYIVALDPRYDFSGIWTPLLYGGARLAAVPGIRTLAAVVPRAISRDDLDATVVPLVSQVMPACSAEYAVSPGNEILLNSGALLVKTPDNQAVYVSTNVNSQPVTVRLSGGALAMITALDGSVTVANLCDNAPDAVLVSAGNCLGATPVRVGHLAELTAGACAVSQNLPVAYTSISAALTNGINLEMMRFSYPRAFKRFNLTRSLPTCDFARVMKTAAAVSYIDREREWNGFELRAP